MGVAFGVVCGALVFAHIWLFTSLAAAKVLAVLAVFSFLAWRAYGTCAARAEAKKQARDGTK